MKNFMEVASNIKLKDNDIHCKQCGKKISSSKNFCKYCGTKIIKYMFCEECREKMQEDAKFCDNCGYPVAAYETTPVIRENACPLDNKLRVDEEYAGFWIRLGAFFIDLIIIHFIVCYIALLNGFFVQFYIDSDTTYLLMLFLLIVGYYTATLSIFSTTFGKMLFGLRIVDSTTNEKVSVRKALGRVLSYLASVLLFGLGFLAISFNEEKKGWHDRIAGTQVFREKNFNITLGIIVAFICFIATIYILFGPPIITNYIIKLTNYIAAHAN